MSLLFKTDQSSYESRKIGNNAEVNNFDNYTSVLEKCIEQLNLIGWDFHLNCVICPPPLMIMIISPFICILILWFNAEFSDGNIHDYVHKLHTDDAGASQSPENGQMARGGKLCNFSEYGIMMNTQCRIQTCVYKTLNTEYWIYNSNSRRWCCYIADCAVSQKMLGASSRRKIFRILESLAI